MLVDATTGALREMFSAGRAEAACMVALSRTELLAVKDSTGLLVGPDGSAKHKAGAPGLVHPSAGLALESACAALMLLLQG